MPRSPATRSLLFRAAPVGLLLCTAGLVGLFLHLQDRRAAQPLPTSTAHTPTPITADQISDIAQSLRAMKLVSVEWRTSVQSSSRDNSFLGAVNAEVNAPVILHFGVDLEQLDPSRITFSPLHQAYLVRLPPPVRLAVEVLGQFEQARVSTGWLRRRASEGEHHLGIARRDLHLRAQQLVPDHDQQLLIREQTRERVAELVRKVAGPSTLVSVRFEDDP
jgi:hypothetical protein